MKHTWSKTLTRSDAQVETTGAKIPFLRFTQAGTGIDHASWFRDVFFATAAWRTQDSSSENAEIDIYVQIPGGQPGTRRMRLDHRSGRSKNNSAPTTYLYYDERTKQEMESSNLTGYKVVVTSNSGEYSFVVSE